MWSYMGGIVLVVILGYGSNAMSQTACLENTAYPQVRIRTNAWVPFVISERFDAAADATKRASFTAHYIAMFGIPLSLGDSVDMPTLSP